MTKANKRSPVIQALQLTALFMGVAIWQQKPPHMYCERVALAEFRFCHLGKHFYGSKRLW
jgi:hypothetical protein